MSQSESQSEVTDKEQPTTQKDEPPKPSQEETSKLNANANETETKEDAKHPQMLSPNTRRLSDLALTKKAANKWRSITPKSIDPDAQSQSQTQVSGFASLARNKLTSFAAKLKAPRFSTTTTYEEDDSSQSDDTTQLKENIKLTESQDTKQNDENNDNSNLDSTQKSQKSQLLSSLQSFASGLQLKPKFKDETKINKDLPQNQEQKQLKSDSEKESKFKFKLKSETIESKLIKTNKAPMQRIFKYDDIKDENMNIMSDLLAEQCQKPLEKVTVDVKELHTKQEEILDRVTKEKLWFKKDQIAALRNMQQAIREIPTYQVKVTRMNKKMNELNRRVARLKFNSSDLLKRIQYFDAMTQQPFEQEQTLQLPSSQQQSQSQPEQQTVGMLSQ